MGIYDHEAAFGAADKTSRAMRRAIQSWFDLYYRQGADKDRDPGQRIAYTVVNKLTKAVFGEYRTSAEDPQVAGWLRELDKVKKTAVQLALLGGECFIKPCPDRTGFSFTLVRRDNVLIFARDPAGRVTDMGTMERYQQGNHYFTLLERRQVDGQGYLTITNRLYRSNTDRTLGQEVSLGAYPGPKLAAKYTYPEPVWSVGVAPVRTPMVNCVDGSRDAVSVLAPAVDLIQAIDRNEALLNGEFERGQSRVLVSRDLLDRGELTDNLFVGLDEDPQVTGITVFAPQLREQSYLARKQEYLRNVESLMGLKRGMLSDANVEDRTATEIAASGAEYALTVLEFQTMWETAVRETVALCAFLAPWYGLGKVRSAAVSLDWGNGVLYDQDAQLERNLALVQAGLLKPELALGWRFGLKTDTEADLAQIRQKLMPGK